MDYRDGYQGGVEVVHGSVSVVCVGASVWMVECQGTEWMECLTCLIKAKVLVNEWRNSRMISLINVRTNKNVMMTEEIRKNREWLPER